MGKGAYERSLQLLYLVVHECEFPFECLAQVVEFGGYLIPSLARFREEGGQGVWDIVGIGLGTWGWHWHGGRRRAKGSRCWGSGCVLIVPGCLRCVVVALGGCRSCVLISFVLVTGTGTWRCCIVLPVAIRSWQATVVLATRCRQ
jgi:hypothetical protein